MDFKTLVIDSVTQLESVIWDYTCQRNGYSSIESPGYGRGYVEADTDWRNIFNGLRKLRDVRDMYIVLIAHDDVKMVNDPTTSTSYDRFQMRLHKRAEALVREQLDILAFMRYRSSVVKNDNGSQRFFTDNNRSISLQPNPAYTAKCRYPNLPEIIDIPQTKGFEKIETYFKG